MQQEQGQQQEQQRWWRQQVTGCVLIGVLVTSSLKRNAQKCHLPGGHWQTCNKKNSFHLYSLAVFPQFPASDALPGCSYFHCFTITTVFAWFVACRARITSAPAQFLFQDSLRTCTQFFGSKH